MMTHYALGAMMSFEEIIERIGSEMSQQNMTLSSWTPTLKIRKRQYQRQ